MTNFKLVLRTYAAMREMTPDDLALLGTLRALSDADREHLITTMSDKPVKKAGKKSVGKDSGGRSSKSARATGMAKALNDNLSQRRQETIPDVVERDTEEPARCQFIRADGRPCNLLPDHNIHHLQTANEYHEFQPAAVTQPARREVGSEG